MLQTALLFCFLRITAHGLFSGNVAARVVVLLWLRSALRQSACGVLRMFARKSQFAVAHMQHRCLSNIIDYPLLRIDRTTPRFLTQGGEVQNHSALAAPHSTIPKFVLLSPSRSGPTRRLHRVPPILLRQPRDYITRPYSWKSTRSFSGASRKMTAEKIDGTAIAKDIRTKIQAEIKQKQETNPRYKPSLTIVQGIEGHTSPRDWTCANLRLSSRRQI